MKRIWIQRIGAAVLCAVLLAGCMPGGPAADSTASADPLTGQEQQYPGQRPAAVVIDNAPGSTTQWGIGSASVVLEAAARADTAPSLCLVYPSVSAMPTVGPVTLGQDLFWRLLSGQQVLPIQRGCDLYTRNFLDYWNLRAVDALETGRNAFTTGNTDWASPLWCTNGQSVAKVLGSLSLSSALSEDPAGSADSTGTPPPYPLSRPCCLSRPTATCRMRTLPTQFRRQYSSHPAAPPALPTIPTPAPTGCCTMTAPRSWTPTPASRLPLTTFWCCTVPLPRGTMAAPWTTT